MSKVVPWLVAAMFAIAAAVLHFHYQGVIASKDAELTAVQDQLKAMAASSETKLKAVSEQVAAAEQKASEIAAKAAEKVQEIAAAASAKVEEVKAEASTKLQAASLPEATVNVTFRKAIFSSGQVAVIANTSPAAISATFTASRPSTGVSKSIDLTLDPNRPKEIGEREGWAFVAGDRVQVEQPGHKGRTFNP